MFDSKDEKGTDPKAKKTPKKLQAYKGGPKKMQI